MTADWKSRTSFLAPNCVTVTIRDEKVKFFSLSPRCLTILTDITKPLASAINAFLDSRQEATKMKQEKITYTGEEPGTRETVESEPVLTHEAMVWMSNQRRTAVEQLIDVVSSENINKLGDLLVDSMRELYPRTEPRPTGEEFIEEVGMDSLYPLVSGMLEANEKVLGPFLGKVKALIAEAKEKRDTDSKDSKDSKEPETKSTKDDGSTIPTAPVTPTTPGPFPISSPENVESEPLPPAPAPDPIPAEVVNPDS